MLQRVGPEEEYLWLDITVTDSLGMQDLQPLQDLPRDFLGSGFCLFAVADVFTEVAMLDILESEKYMVLVLVPAMELDKQVFILSPLSA